jgi:hypothetical protein
MCNDAEIHERSRSLRGFGGYRPWAELLRRTFTVDVETCPRCGGRMRLLAVITDPAKRRTAAASPRRAYRATRSSSAPRPALLQDPRRATATATRDLPQLELFEEH